ncbi:MAG: aminotransferase class V-fold PLP-dependent enzyme [Melioribacteraceae bacterium]|jgi:dTDP-4-amino-4,6-dideoxygalactose transaminase|nr:MAG: aminotransferase class V-fold PLP-dependent enzyme [Melioribacteraceae bacterium]
MPDKLPELNNILYSGKLSYGYWGEEFEKAISSYIGNEYFLSVNSFNSALLVAIAVLELKPGDEVIASPMSCLASNQPFATQNLKVVWADIDPKTGTLDPSDVKRKITKQTKAIFHNHHCGYVGYVEEINQIARQYGLYVVDDAIEAFGSEYSNKKMGNLGADITAFSFQTVRLPNTIDGGGLSFCRKELYERALLIRDLGVNRKKFRDENGEISKKCDIALPGFGATLNETSAYIGLQQVHYIDSLLGKQNENATVWNVKLKEIKNISLLNSINGSKPNYWVYGCFAENKLEAISFFRERNYYASGIHLPNNNYSIFNSKIELKGVNEFYTNFIALPSGWWVNSI